jgi:putative ABC transport system ATP-binding protein
LFEFNQQNQTSLVLVTHDEHLAQRCQRSIHIEDGMIVNDAVNEGNLAEVKDSRHGANA